MGFINIKQKHRQMQGYLSSPQYREPLMYDGGDVEVQKRGCEEADKCCFCIPAETAMKIVTVLAWINAVGVVAIAVGMGEVGAIANTGLSAAHVTITSDSMNGDLNKKIASYDNNAISTASDWVTGFMIVSFISAAFCVIAALLMSFWMCCSNGSEKGGKALYFGAIAQAIAFIVAFFMMPTVAWSGVIACIVDMLWYVYICVVAKHIYSKTIENKEEAPMMEAPMAAINEEMM